MYLLRLTCRPEQVDFVIAELWEYGTAGIEQRATALIATFETDGGREELLKQFQKHSPEWQSADAVDWAEKSRAAWPGRMVGERLFLTPPWSNAPTPPGRKRVIHNPGLACGTGEHPCTQLALIALERCVEPGTRVLDAGTGSGILAIAALQLGAGSAIGVDTDDATLRIAKENFELNHFPAMLIAGSADAIQDHRFDVTVANINGTVLLSIVDELMRITRRDGSLILTGFPDSEARAFRDMFPQADVLSSNEWQCLIAKLSSRVFERV